MHQNHQDKGTAPKSYRSLGLAACTLLALSACTQGFVAEVGPQIADATPNQPGRCLHTADFVAEGLTEVSVLYCRDGRIAARPRGSERAYIRAYLDTQTGIDSYYLHFEASRGQTHIPKSANLNAPTGSYALELVFKQRDKYWNRAERGFGANGVGDSTANNLGGFGGAGTVVFKILDDDIRHLIAKADRASEDYLTVQFSETFGMKTTMRISKAELISVHDYIQSLKQQSATDPV